MNFLEIFNKSPAAYIDQQLVSDVIFQFHVWCETPIPYPIDPYYLIPSSTG